MKRILNDQVYAVPVDETSYERYTSPEELCNTTMYGEPLKFFKAPWFDANALRNVGLLKRYMDGSGTLPGGLTAQAISSLDWSIRIVTLEDVLEPQFARTTTQGKLHYMEIVRKRLSRCPRSRLIPVDFQADTWWHRKDLEVA